MFYRLQDLMVRHSNTARLVGAAVFFLALAVSGFAADPIPGG